MDLIFSQRFERTVDRDNTVSFHNLVIEIEPAEWHGTMAGCKVIIPQHLDAALTLTIAGHLVEHYSAERKLLTRSPKSKSRPWKRREAEVRKPTFYLLANPAHNAACALSHRLYAHWKINQS